MKATKIGSRFVLIGPPAPAPGQTAVREPASRKTTSHRIAVIKNGEPVGSRPPR